MPSRTEACWLVVAVLVIGCGPSESGACRFNSECPRGRYCMDGTCVDGVCTTDAECVAMVGAGATCTPFGMCVGGRDAGSAGTDAGVDSGAVPTDDAGSANDAGSPDDAATPRDSGSIMDASEGGTTGVDASMATDASMLVDASVVRDASTPADAGIDAGAAGDAGISIVAPVIDGVVSDVEWSGAMVARNTTITAWTGNELSAMRVLLRSEGLYLAIEGRVEAGTSANAIVVYVDRARGTSEGRDVSAVTDTLGALDDALSPASSAPFTTPADFHPDLAWGTNAMSRSASGFDDGMGWRDLVRAVSPSDLYWISASEAPTTCGAAACETFLPRALLDMGMGAGRPRTIALFARIVNADNSMSPNETLPLDDPSMPRVVSVLTQIVE